MAAVLDKLKITDIVAICDAYGATLFDLEKIIRIEHIAYPLMQAAFSS